MRLTEVSAVQRTRLGMLLPALVAALFVLTNCSGDKKPKPESQPAATRPASAPASKPAVDPAEQLVDLRGPGLTSGMVWTFSEKVTWQGAGRLTVQHGPEQDGLAAVQKTRDQRVEVLAVTDGDLPVSVRVEQQRAHTLFEMNGDQTTQAAPYFAQTVEYKYDDNGACALIVKAVPKPQPEKKKKRGKAPREEAAPPAVAPIDHDIGCPKITHLLYPKTPVRPGDGWSPSADAVRLALGVQQPNELVLQVNRMTLQKVENTGERMARIVWELQCAINGADKAHSEFAVKVSIQRSLDRFIDVETRWLGKLVDELPLDRGQLRMDGNYELTARSEPAAHAAPVP